MTARSRRMALLAILAGSALVRLHHLSAPMADALQAKQVYVANKARSIARAPIDPLRNTLDFLDERGERMPLIEEVPLYTGLLGLGYRIFGERDWVGHALSLVGSLAAIAAFFDLVRREMDDRRAIAATILLSASPLFVFYGRAVLPDPWMLAGMLTSAACYQRYVDGCGRRWLVLAAIAGSFAALFKYFGLMVLIPLAEMARRKSGSWRAALSPSFLAMASAMVLPTFAWMAAVFVRSPNPVTSGWSGGGAAMPYLIAQAPGVLLEKPFWAGLLGRFPARDCGIVTAGLMSAGMISALARRSGSGGFRAIPAGESRVESRESRGQDRGPRAEGRGARVERTESRSEGLDSRISTLDSRLSALGSPAGTHLTWSWTITGLLFYVLLGPKLRDHDYYELMMLPAAALWAVRGLDTLGSFFVGQAWACRSRPWTAGPGLPYGVGGAFDDRRPASQRLARERLAIAILALAVIVQSPWISSTLFRQDDGKIALAGRLRDLCPPSDRVVAIGPGIEFPTVVHYSRREGWPIHSPTLPPDWRDRLDRYRARGARLVAVYFEPKATASQRASYAPLLRALPVVEHRSGVRTRAGGPCEFVILSLGEGRRRE